MARPKTEIARRLEAKFEPEPNTGCWLWTAQCQEEGYGRLWDNDRKKSIGAHVASYEIHVGPIPAGLHLDHLCRNPPCINPKHLEPVTFVENLRRAPLAMGGHNLAKTHCKQGHPYSGDNLFFTKKGWRGCRTCMRANNAVQHQKRKAENGKL